jgi:hypothetical protein
MLQKILMCKKEEFQPCWVKDMGSYNRMPVPYREITEEDYIQKAAYYSPEYMESRQVYDKDLIAIGTYANVTIYWYESNGIAIVWPKGAEKVRYFSIGCTHKNSVGLSKDECDKRGIYHGGRCYHVSECSDCGYISEIDSSD